MSKKTVFLSLTVVCVILLAGIGLLYKRHKKQAYDPAFFENMDRSARQSAEAVVPELVRILKPRSMVDVGSGNGFWTKAFLDNGVTDAVAVDGPWVEKSSLKVPPQDFVVRDLSQPLHMDRTFDLVLCLETAEHLRPERADGFVQELTALAPLIVFSAAIPCQGGTMHYNEEWQDYWSQKFTAQGFVAVDMLRPLFWNNARISGMYRQNMVLYVRKDRLETLGDEVKKAPVFSPTSAGSVYRMVHPVVYENGVHDAAYESRWQTKVKHLIGLE